MITIRLTAAVKRSLEASARKRGLTLSAWLVSSALEREAANGSSS